MNIVNIQSLIAADVIATLADINPATCFIQGAAFQAGNRKINSANANSYKPFVISIADLIAGGGVAYTGSNGITLVGNDFQFTSQNISQFTNDSGYITAAGAWVPGGNTFGILSRLGTLDNFDLPIYTNGTEKLRLTTDGRLGLGTSNINTGDYEYFKMYTDTDFAIKFVVENATPTGGYAEFKGVTDLSDFRFKKSQVFKKFPRYQELLERYDGYGVFGWVDVDIIEDLIKYLEKKV